MLLLHSGALSHTQLMERHLGPSASNWVEVPMPAMTPRSALVVHTTAHADVSMQVINGRVWPAHDFATTHSLEDGSFAIALTSDTTSSWTHTVIVSDVWVHQSASGVYMEEKPHIEYNMVSAAAEEPGQRSHTQELDVVVTSGTLTSASIVDHSSTILPVQVTVAFVEEPTQCFAGEVLMCAFSQRHHYEYDCGFTNTLGYVALSVPAGETIIVRDGCQGTDTSRHAMKCEAGENRPDLAVVVANATVDGQPVTELVIPAEKTSSGAVLYFEDRTQVQLASAW